MAVWLQLRADNPFIAITYPFLILAVILWSATPLWERIPLTWIERFVLAAITLLFLSKLLYLWFGVPAPTFTSILFIIGYIALDRRAALGFSTVRLLVSALAGIWRFWPGQPGGGIHPP